MINRPPEKRCFHLTHCEFESRCELAHVDVKYGQFEPRRVGEHCDHFKPLCADMATFHSQWGIGACDE